MTLTKTQQNAIIQTAMNSTHINHMPTGYGWCKITAITKDDGAGRLALIIVKKEDGERASLVVEKMVYEKTFFEKREDVALPSIQDPLKVLHEELTAVCKLFDERTEGYNVESIHDYNVVVKNVCVVFNNPRRESGINSLTSSSSPNDIVAYYRAMGLPQSTAVALVGVEIMFEAARVMTAWGGEKWIKDLFQMLRLVLPELEKAISSQ